MKQEICLVMIVKNEEKIIERCLRSALPHITSYAISDTGSTDNTCQIINDVLKDIPGVLTKVGWRDFSYNRTLSFQMGQIQSKYKGYCLLLDADHEFMGEVRELYLDYYMIEQRSSDKRYPNIRLVSSKIDWKCIGVTHEYWAGGLSGDTLEGCYILDHEDGGTRGDKWVRDEALLRQGLIDEPNNERYVFYLAQTIESSNKQEAIQLYTKRSMMGGYHEEAWMAQYRAATHAENELGVLYAWEAAPHRAEPLYWLARRYRQQGKNQLAVLYAEKAKSIPMPKNSLFVDVPAYTWGPEEEISISGYYVDKAKGFDAVERCIEYPETRELASRNVAYYAEALFRIDSGKIKVPELEGYSPGTVSICDDVISVRMLNYDQKYGREFIPRDGTGVFNCQTRLFTGDRSFTVNDSLLYKWDISGTHIHGLEDWRLFKHNGRMMFTANCCMVPECRGGPQVVIGTLSEDLCRVEKLTHPKYDKANWCEKNWQTLPSDDVLELVYSYDPFVVLQIRNGIATEKVRRPGKGLPRWRGSAPPIKIGDYYIGIVHDVIYNTGTSDNVYLHRFVAINESKDDLIAVSKPFKFEHLGIEYTAGMQLVGDERGNLNLVKIVYSVKEYKTKWLVTPVTFILDMLGLK